jgi:hypothetical protein
VFFEQGEDWEAAEVAIKALRDEAKRAADPIARTLQEVAPKEVEFVYHLFSSNTEAALQDARSISDKLSGGSELKAYRAWWYYLSGSVAWWRARAGQPGAKEVAVDMFKRAAEAAFTVSWFSELAEAKILSLGSVIAPLLGYAVEEIQRVLTTLGFVGPKFEREMQSFIKSIESNDHDTFALGVKLLGGYIGFDASIPTGVAVPDAVWKLHDRVLVFEVKIHESPDNPTSVSTCRETSGHIKWAVDKDRPYQKIDAILISRRTTLDSNAKVHASDIFFVHVDEVRKLAKMAERLLREVRAISSSSPGDGVGEVIAQKLKATGLDPESMFRFLTKQPLGMLPEK